MPIVYITNIITDSDTSHTLGIITTNISINYANITIKPLININITNSRRAITGPPTATEEC